jgi:hypothetical protein
MNNIHFLGVGRAVCHHRDISTLGDVGPAAVWFLLDWKIFISCLGRFLFLASDSLTHVACFGEQMCANGIRCVVKFLAELERAKAPKRYFVLPVS